MKTLELLPPNDTMYRALVNRDSSFEGIFFVGVRTTGIFCRPTCSAKKPARENVEFFPSPNEALLGGYRPCLRCQPMDPARSAPELIERLRAEVEKAPDGRLTDKELASLAIDPSTARRQFKRYYGMTFQAYHRARRMGRALARGAKRRTGGRCAQRQRLRIGERISRGFHQDFRRPAYRGEESATVSSRNESRLRWARCWPWPTMKACACSSLAIAARSSASCRFSGSAWARASFPANTSISMPTREQLADYFAGKNLEFDVPLAPVGSEFQLRDWEVLRSIPAGETRSYSWMAERMGDPGARRAVGRANGTNMICIIIPCHRVIRADGTLCGYGGGLWRKKWLLEHERKVMGDK